MYCGQTLGSTKRQRQSAYERTECSLSNSKYLLTEGIAVGGVPGFVEPFHILLIFVRFYNLLLPLALLLSGLNASSITPIQSTNFLSISLGATTCIVNVLPR